MTAATAAGRVAAVIPAAGASRRMGRPKLLIEVDGRPLIVRVVTTLREAGVVPVLVVSPPHHTPEGPPLIEAAAKAGAVVVAPESRPEEMRDSFEIGVAELARSASPPDGVLLTPGDSPRLDAKLVEQLLQAWRSRPERIVVPTFNDRRGHPIILPWRLAQAVERLPAGVGVNSLVVEYAGDVEEIPRETDAILADLDTPDDLAAYRLAFPPGGGGWPEGPDEEDDPHCKRLQPSEGPRGHGRRSVRLFAIARQLAGDSEIVVDLPEAATVADLRRALVEQHPALAGVASRVRIAVGDEYADEEASLPPDAPLALIPPVSGGGDR